MAGDWIKVEKSSARKPEVLLIARTLGVPQDSAFGLLVRFWIWLDDNCVDGVVDGVVDADVDALMSCDGLSALLKLVGWVKFDDDPPRMSVCNFDRHNGETSKNRALKNERQAKWRASVVDATPSTREEKKRKELKAIEHRPPKTCLAEPTAEHQNLAKELGVACQAEFLKYKDWLAANGKSHKNQVAGFNNWLRRAKEFKREVPGSGLGLTAAHLPAKLPELGEHTEMPTGMLEQLKNFRLKTI